MHLIHDMREACDDWLLALAWNTNGAAITKAMCEAGYPAWTPSISFGRYFWMRPAPLLPERLASRCHWFFHLHKLAAFTDAELRAIEATAIAACEPTPAVPAPIRVGAAVVVSFGPFMGATGTVARHHHGSAKVGLHQLGYIWMPATWVEAA